jgi:methyltransferase, fkbM family
MVFGGGEHVFTKLQPVVYTEMLRKHVARFDYHPNEIIAMFKGWGYDCYAPEGERVLLHRAKHSALREKYCI